MSTIKASEFDKKFDEGESIFEDLDLSTTRKANEESMRVTVDFPKWMVNSLDKKSNHLGISRQALIKLFVADQFRDVL